MSDFRPDTIVTISDAGGSPLFTFHNEEVPEQISFGGEQSLKVHQLVGGDRVVDAMGRSDQVLEWSGLMLGQDALDRARLLDLMRVQGLPLRLSWDNFDYLIVIQSFKADFVRFYRIPYHIACVVVSDNVTLASNVLVPAVDAVVTQDMTDAAGFVTSIGDSGLSAAFATLQTAMSTISSVATAAQSQIQGVLQAVQTVRTQISILVASTANTINNVVSLGGLLPNTSIAQKAAALTSKVAAITQQQTLVNLDIKIGRVAANLLGAQSGSATITKIGGDLFHVAADSYQDATKWVDIARANGLSDPQLSGVNTIKVPAVTSNSGGVLSG